MNDLDALAIEVRKRIMAKKKMPSTRLTKPPSKRATAQDPKDVQAAPKGKTKKGRR